MIIDNVSKFISVQTCLALIDERYNKGLDETKIGKEFENAVVMTKYGAQRTYRVSRIRWDMTPQKYSFEQGEAGKKTNMLEYFTRAYSTKIKVPDQPLFEVEQKRGTIYLPPELCTMVGIPAKIRENKRTMADIRQSLFQSPNERIASI